MSERINKVLAQLGYGSRRAVDQLISEDRVMVNGAAAKLGHQVNLSDTITVDGKVISQDKPSTVILKFNKPRGVTTTKKDPFAKVTVMDYLPKHFQHLYPVGRLDKESRGLLLLTNNGELAQRLTHPKFEHEKEYDVTIKPFQPQTTNSFKQSVMRLTKQIVAKDNQTQPIQVLRSSFNPQTQIGYATVVLQEGRKRQIRHMFQAIGYFVTDLQRTRIGKLRLADLPEGRYAEIDHLIL